MKKISHVKTAWSLMLILTVMFFAIVASAADRFTDNGDGTVTDSGTGTIWLKNANCFGMKNWNDAVSAAAGLGSGQCGLTDGSTAGDWHLATLDEFKGSMDGIHAITQTLGDDPFIDIRGYWYWTGTGTGSDDAWAVNVGWNETQSASKKGVKFVWPVKKVQQGNNCNCPPCVPCSSSGGQSCATVNLQNLDIDIPCIDVGGTKYKIKFKYAPDSSGGGLSWKLDAYSVEEVQ